MSTSKKVQMTDAQRARFKEFEATTGGDAHGLEDFEDGHMSFAEAEHRLLPSEGPRNGLSP